MPKIINQSTGHEQTVSERELSAILANPLTRRLYKVVRTKEPVELRQNKKFKPKKAEDSHEGIVANDDSEEQTNSV